MITNFNQNQFTLQILFAYIDSCIIGSVPPIIGRPP
ncbi:ISNCY family transposase, partial [Bacillus sp. D-CC]